MKLSLKQRRDKILSVLSEIPISTTLQLAEQTNVSSETIRKDLEALSKEGLIIKVHGGVALSNPEPGEAPFDLRAAVNLEQKVKIAKAAINLISPGDSIILESCTSCLELCKILLANPELLGTLIIITNSFSIANLLEGGKYCQKLFFLGGWCNPNEHATRGYHTTKFLDDCYVDIAFISGAALGKDMTLTSYLEEDMLFQRQALKIARNTILLMDKAKFKNSAFFSVCPMTSITSIVTDLEKNSELIDSLSSSNINVVLAE
ncbi:MAG: DeoR/GlpR family DNA-binding transcription regulator [Cellulosilyticaceae bacterium]